MNFPVKFEECLLDGVLGILLAAHQAQSGPEERLLVALVEHPISHQVTFPASPDESLLIYPGRLALFHVFLEGTFYYRLGHIVRRAEGPEGLILERAVVTLSRGRRIRG
jgi:hypothetical protein